MTSKGLTLTIPFPAGVVDGDLLVAFISSKIPSGDINTPSGWTAVGPRIAAGGWITGQAFYRIAASEGASQNFTTTVSERSSGVMLRIDGQHASTFLNAFASDSNTSSSETSSVSPSVTTTADGCLVLSFHANRDAEAPTDGAPPSGMSQVAHTTASFGAAAAVAQATQATMGATGAKSWTLDAAGAWITWTVAIAPATTGGGGGGGTSEGGRPVIPRGLYLKNGEGDESGIPLANFWTRVNSSARVRGACVIIFWDNIETSKGVYDFNVIDNAITEANAISKKLTLELRVHSYGASAENVTTVGVPSYIWQGSEYGGVAGAYGLARKHKNQYSVRQWDPQVMERVALLFEAVLTYCSGKLPSVVFNNETTPGAIDANNPDANDYTPARQVAQYKILIERATAAAGSDTRFGFVANFIRTGNNQDGGDLDTLYDYCVDNDAGWSAPDPLSLQKPVDDWLATAFRMQQQDLAATGTIANPSVSGVAPIPYIPLGEEGAGAFRELAGGYLGSGKNLLDLMLYMIEQCGMEFLAMTTNYNDLSDYAGGVLLGYQEVITLLDDSNVPAADLAVLQAWADAEDSEGGVTGAAAQSLPSLTQSAAGTIRSGTIVQTLPSLTQSASGATATFVGSMAQSLPSLVQAAAGTHTIQANVGAQTLPSLSQSATGRTFYWMQVIPGTESWRVQ